MSNLPKSWTILPLGKACKTVKGKKPSNSGAQNNERKIPYINIKAFESRIPEEYAEPGNYPTCNEDDVLIVWDGSRSGLVGRGVVGYIGSTLARIYADGVSNDFLYYFLQSKYHEINSRVKGVGIPHVDPQVLNTIGLPIPPSSEQTRIVAEIEKQFTRLDVGVSAVKRLQANLKQYRASILKSACEGRLVPTEAELAKKEKRIFETAQALLNRILDERRKNWRAQGKYKEPLTPKNTKINSLPEGWAWATFEQIAERVTVGFVGSMKHEYVEEGVPFLRSQNVRENRFDPSGLLFISEKFHQKLSKSEIRPGDLAVVRSGSVGVTCVIPNSLQSANCSDLVLIQRPRGFVPQYGAYFMNSLAKRHVAAGKVGVALIHFNTKSVAALAVPLPPLAEQMRIVAEVERRLSVVDKLDAVASENLRRAANLRQTILQKAFMGQLLEQVPNERPVNIQMDSHLENSTKSKRSSPMPKNPKSISLVKQLSVLEVLSRANKQLSPEDLFSLCGLDSSNISDVECFFDELKRVVEEGKVEEVRLGIQSIQLRVKP